MTQKKLMTKQEKINKGIEFIESGLYNLSKIPYVGTRILPTAETQIYNGLKLIKNAK